MESKPIMNVVATRCRPVDDEKFNKWYNEVHIPMLLKFKGIKEVTRYKILNDSEEYPTYLTLYTYENQDALKSFASSPELAAVMAETKETWKGEGFEIVWRVPYEHIKTWKR